MTPLECAARNIVRERYYRLGHQPGGPVEGYVDQEWQNGVDDARAVLTAIREPSESVRQAMRDNVPVDGHEWDYLMPETLSNGMILDDEADCWRAMIDAMLKEG